MTIGLAFWLGFGVGILLATFLAFVLWFVSISEEL